MYVLLAKIAFELQRHLVMITVHWKKKKNYKMLFIYFFSCHVFIYHFAVFSGADVLWQKQQLQYLLHI